MNGGIVLKAIVFIFALGFVLFSAPVLSEASYGGQTLSKGMSHSDVEELQDLLMTKGVFPYHTSTGYFGEITEKSVTDFQRRNNLQVDGIAGPETNRALQIFRRGDIGKHVTHIQHQLKDLGYYTSAVDGIFGPGTERAVINFQQSAGLTVDGIAGPQTLSALNDRSNPNTYAGKEMTVESTAYTAYCDGCSGITRMGIDLRQYDTGKVIAVDPNVIPLGSIVEVEGYGLAIAADIGGAINGKKIDVFIPDRNDALQWGRKDVKITIIK